MNVTAPQPARRLMYKSSYRSFHSCTHSRHFPSTSLLHIRWRQRLHHTGTFAETSAEDAIRVLEHAVLQTDDDELRALETRLDETADILSM
jgi:hypothetical protein